MFRQNLVKYLRRIVEGKSKMPDLPFLFPFLCMLKQMAVLNDTAPAVQPIVEFRVQDVKQVLIHIVCPQIFKLSREYILHLILCLYKKGRKLCGDGKLLSRIPFHHTFP